MWPLVIGALVIFTIAVLVAATISLVGALSIYTDAVSDSKAPLAALGDATTRQRAIDAALAEIGGPERHAEVRRESVQLSIGTVVTFAPDDEGAATAQRVELLAAWIERSAVTVTPSELTPFLDCVAGVGTAGQAGRCTLGGRLHDELVEFAAATGPPASSCGPEDGYRVELFVGAVASGEGLPKDCAGASTTPTTR